jgi:hypothetical protein
MVNKHAFVLFFRQATQAFWVTYRLPLLLADKGESGPGGVAEREAVGRGRRVGRLELIVGLLASGS